MSALNLDIRPTPRLTSAERSQRTAELFESAQAAHGPQRRELLNEVVCLNLRIAEALAQRFAHRGISSDDLVQVASIGLVKAAERFDPALGKDFLAFAVPTIRGELQRHFRDAGWVVRPTRRVQETRWKINRAVADLTQRLGHTPVAQEVMDELGLTHEEYAEASSANGCFLPTSLDQPASVHDEGTSLGDLLADDGRDSSASEARLTLAPVVRELPQRDRRVLYLRYFEDLGQREIGEELGVTQTQVSRILDRILGQLRDELSSTSSANATTSAA